MLFVTGQVGSGRSHALQAAAEGVRAQGIAEAVLGRVRDGTYERAEDEPEEPSRTARLQPLISSALALGADLLTPTLRLIDEILKVSEGARRLLREAREREEPVEMTELATRLLRVAAAERPLLCVVDDADSLESEWWLTLQFGFAREIADELPIVLVLALDEPNEVADGLLTRELAGRFDLPELTEHEIRSWLGRAPDDLVRTALETTSGRSGHLAELWADWERRGVVERSDDIWQAGPNAERSLADATELLLRKLRLLLGSDDPKLVGDVTRLVAYAALEGPVFTAEAAGASLGWDRETTNDLLDDRLATGRDDVEPLFAEVGGVEVQSTRGETHTLWRYRFVRGLEWRVAATRLLATHELPGAAATLARCLETAYRPETHHVVSALARLWGVAGDVGAAHEYRISAEHTSSLIALRSLARSLLTVSVDGWGPQDFEDAVRLLVDAAERLGGTEPYADTLRLTARAEDLAMSSKGAGALASARQMHGELYRASGNPEEARRCLESARDLARVGAPITLVKTHISLGDLETETGEPARARANLERALEISRQTHNASLEATCLYRLASLELSVSNYDAARQYAEHALDLDRRIDNRFNESSCLHLLGTIAHFGGDYDEARTLTEQALTIKRELGSVHDEAACLRQLGAIELSLERYDSAHPLLTRALSIQMQVGDRDGAAVSLNQLGQVALARDNLPEARALTEESVRLNREIGDRVDAAMANRQLADIALAEGDRTGAREELDRAVQLAREVGHVEEAANWLHHRAVMDIEDERYAEAREALHTVLEAYREFEGREAAAAAVSDLAVAEYMLGELTRAQSHLAEAVATYGELGLRQAQAENIRTLGVLEFEAGRQDEALARTNEAMRIFEELGHPEGIAACQEQLEDMA